MNPTGLLYTLFFKIDWLNTPLCIFRSLMLAAAAALYLPPQSHPLPLSKHQCSIACSLCLIYRQCHPCKQRSLTSQSSSVESFEVCSNQHRSCRELPWRGGCCRWWCWAGGWLCKCKCDQYENGLFFCTKQHSGYMHQSKNSYELKLFLLILNPSVSVFDESCCFISH